MFQDFKHALRMLSKSPAATAAMILAIALGIGANSAIFSVLDAVVLKPLPYPDAERLVSLWIVRANRPGQKGNFSLPDYLDLRAQTSTFDGLSAFNESSVARTDAAEAEHVTTGVVTSDFFDTLGVRPAIGREFTIDEERSGSDKSVLVSDAYWRRAFGASPDALGKQITLDGERYAVVGVLPAGLQVPMFSEEPDLWMPLSYGPDDLERGMHYLGVIGRVRTGTDAAVARADAGAVADRLAATYPESNAGTGVDLGSLRDSIVGDVRPVLYVMLGAVALVLLIACANVANLMLAKATARSREVAVRAALGASRARLVRQFLIESVVVAATGGLVGLALAWWGVDALVAMSGDALPRTSPIGIDVRVLGFTAALSVACGVAFGLVPAFQASSVDPQEALVEGGRGSTGGRGRARSAFVVAQVALSLVLLVGSGLLLRSLVLLTHVDPGFDPTNVMTMQLTLPDATYDEPEKQAAFVRQLVDRVRSSPGVESAAVVFPLAYSRGDVSLSYRPAGTPTPTQAADRTSAAWRPITADYFRTMRIPVLRGRAIADTDTETSAPVLVINETMAKKAFGEADPIGKKLRIGYNDLEPEIVGVVGDMRFAGLGKDPLAEMYSPYVQAPWSTVDVLVRSEGDPNGVVNIVREQAAEIDRGVAVYDAATMESRISTSLGTQRFSAMLIGLFALVALALASVGIYAVLAYTVERRRREIGVRMALGAEKRHVLGLVVGNGMVIALVGIGVGLAGAFALTRVLEGMLFGVTATDPVAFAATAAGLAAVALLACYIPARRAARIDPAVALRSE
jgi:predicted permease